MSRLFAAAGMACAALLVLAASAAASQLHSFAGSLGESGSASGELGLLFPPFLEPVGEGPGSGLAVNEETGDIYVADTANHRVSAFDPSKPPAERFLFAFGADVGGPGVDVCTASCAPGTSGHESGELEEPTFIAIDNSNGPSHGDLYVVDSQADTITKFTADGELVTSWAKGGQLSGIPAATATGDLTPSTGKGTATLTKGSAILTNVSTSEGEFAVGQTVLTPEFSELNPSDRVVITAVGPNSLTLSTPIRGVTGNSSISDIKIVAEKTTVTNLNVTSGSFAPRQLVSSEGLGSKELTEIVEANPNSLLISRAADSPRVGATLHTAPLDFHADDFHAVSGVAVDGSGDLLVLSAARLLRLDESTALVRAYHLGLSGSVGISLDASQRVDLLDGFPWGPFGRFTPSSEELESNVFGREREFFAGLVASRSNDFAYLTRNAETIVAVSPACGELCAPSETFGEGTLHKAAGLAIDSHNGTVYVAETEANRVDVFAVALEANTEPATAVKATAATLHGLVDPRSTPVDHCEFQYGTDTSYGTAVPCLDESSDEVGTPQHPLASPAHVHADLTGLAGGTKYHFRLHTSNTGPEYLSAEDREFSTEALAVVEEAFGTEITATSATLKAKINPRGITGTKYRFEWGPCEPSPSDCLTSPYPNAIPTPDVPIGSGSSPVEVTQSLTGLTGGTTYHFRVLAKDDNGTTTSPPHTFVYLPEVPVPGGCANEALREANHSTTLPDCRTYELVSPATKNGALIGAPLFGPRYSIAAGGEGVTATSIQCFAESTACVGDRGYEGSPFVFSRTPGGWQTKAIALPSDVYNSSTTRMLSSGGALFGTRNPDTGDETWYARIGGDEIEALGPFGPPSAVEALKGIGSEFAATDDLTHVMYGTEPSRVRWPFDVSDAQALYEYTGFGQSQPLLVGVTGAQGSNDLISSCGSGYGTGAANYVSMSMSADGGTVLFRALACGGGSGSNASKPVPVNEIYARIDGEGPNARTVAISEPGAPQAPQSNPACTTPQCLTNTTNEDRFRDATVVGASADARRIYFLSGQQLTDEASQDPNLDEATACKHSQGANGCNLYLYEDPQEDPLSGRHLFDASAGDTSGLGPQVQEVLAVSGDGSHVYFIAKGVLTEEPNSFGKRAFEGAENLYVYEHDAAYPQGHVAYVTALTQANVGSDVGGVGFANVTPDGRYLIFPSRLGLTPDARPGIGPQQVYRYDAESGDLTRVSIGFKGFGDDGNGGRSGANASIVAAGVGLVGTTSPGRSDPTMSHDGRYVFFMSPVALTPGALNEVLIGPETFAQNVYGWRAQGASGCAEARGCISLISDGKDVSPAGKLINAVELLGVDASGENAFFTTASQLTWQDTDTQMDYYDARVGGGFAEPARPVPCQGDACKGAGTGAAAESSPATQTFNGPVEGPSKPQKSKKPKRHKKKHQAHKKKHQAHKKGSASKKRR